MSKTLNRVFLMGNLGEKPTLRTSKAGKSYTRLAVATQRFLGTGEAPKTEWHSVFVFGTEAERCAQWLDKGAHVFVEGNLSQWKIENETGNKKYQSAINADHVRFISYGRKPADDGLAVEHLDNSESARNHNAVAHLQ